MSPAHQKLKRGTVLEKTRGGRTRRATVLHVGAGAVTCSALAKPRRQRRHTFKLPLAEDGLPEGWRKAEVRHG